MYTITSTTLNNLKAHRRQTVKITVAPLSGSSFEITEEDILQNGLEVSRSSVTGQRLELGSAIASELILTLDNYDGRFDDKRFEGAELYVQIGIKDWDTNASIVYIPLGYFTVDNTPRSLSRINISALDRMVKFDRLVPTSLAFPMTVSALLSRICSDCGVTLGAHSNMLNTTYSVASLPAMDGLTYRQILQWVCQISGCCAFIDWKGELQVAWYGTSSSLTITSADRYSSDIHEKSLSLSGVTMLVRSEDPEGNTQEQEYAKTNNTQPSNTLSTFEFALDGNELVQGNPTTVLNGLGTRLGFSYIPWSAETYALPHLYPLDRVTFVDKNGVSHSTVVTDVNYKLNSSTTIQGQGVTGTESGWATLDPLTARERQIIDKVASEAAGKKVSSRENAALGLNEALANSMGLYSTTETADNGSIVRYFHDAQTLEASTYIFTMKSGGFAWANEWKGDSTVWTYGMTASGNAVLNAISAFSISADWIQAGTLQSTNGNLSFDLDNGTLTVNGSDVGDLSSEISLAGEKIGWIVKSGTSESDFELTDRAMMLASQNIQLVASNGGSNDDVTFSVASVSGAAYGFTKTSDEYYTSNNGGKNNTAALCRVNVSSSTGGVLTLSCINMGETVGGTYDYGVIGKLDTALSTSSSADADELLHTKFTLSASSEQLIAITIPPGSHWFHIKYRKDSSTTPTGDYFKFKRVSGGGMQNASVLSLLSGSAVLSSATIQFTGFVTFSDLSNEGQTTISGSNIHGGTLKLGGASNGNGVLEIYDTRDSLCGEWDNSSLRIYGVDGNSGEETKAQIDDASLRFGRKGSSIPEFWIAGTYAADSTQRDELIIGWSEYGAGISIRDYYGNPRLEVTDGLLAVKNYPGYSGREAINVLEINNNSYSILRYGGGYKVKGAYNASTDCAVMVSEDTIYHIRDAVSYVALDSGNWSDYISTGGSGAGISSIAVATGTISSLGTSWKTVTFSNGNTLGSFNNASRIKVFLQECTYGSENSATSGARPVPKVRYITTTGFEACLSGASATAANYCWFAIQIL